MSFKIDLHTHSFFSADGVSSPEQLIAAAREHHELFNWHHLHSPEHMGRVRIAAMERFLRDFDSGRRQGRYVAGELPSLPFADATGCCLGNSLRPARARPFSSDPT